MLTENPTLPANTDEDLLDPDLPICDPHHHLWDFPGNRYLVQDFLADAAPANSARRHRIESTIFVECRAFYRTSGAGHMKVLGETENVAAITAAADQAGNAPIRVCEAIIGHADLTTGAVLDEILAAHVELGQGRFRGIRHCAGWDASEVVPGYAEPAYHLYLDPAFRAGFGRLAAHGLSFEAWQYHTQLAGLLDLARAFPATNIMLNHTGGPLGIGPYAGRRDEVFQRWLQDIRQLASCPNISVKLGGLGMPICGFQFPDRGDHPASLILAQAWRPYIISCIEAFGVKRSLFESNFPADKATCSYFTIWNVFKRLAANANQSEKSMLFRDNARLFYRLS